MSTVLKLSGKQTSKAQNYAIWLISSYLVVWPLQVETSILILIWSLFAPALEITSCFTIVSQSSS